MGIRLNAPPARTEIPQDQAVNVIRLIVPHILSEGGAVTINREEVRLIGSVVTYGEDGAQIGEDTIVIPLADVPAQGVTLLKQLYEWVEAQAVAQGVIGDGVAEVLEAPVVP